MTLNELINKYTQRGYNFRNAENLAAQEILLTKISLSPLSDHATLKGGIVMFNITRSLRPVTQDIDFDLIRYSLDEGAIKMFIEKLNCSYEEFHVSIFGKIKKLHHEEYEGVRVHVLIADRDHNKIRTKMDIGVHTYSAIEQKQLAFIFDNNNEGVFISVNPPEQICSEKLLSLARLGVLSTRYKDIYDIYFLISNNFADFKDVSRIIKIYVDNSEKKPNTISEFIDSIKETLKNKFFAEEVKKPAIKWIDVDYDTIEKVIINFVDKLN